MPAESLTAPMGVVSGDRAPARDPVAAHVITGLTVSALALFVLLDASEVVATWYTSWPWLLFWTTLVCLVDLFPVSAGRLKLTLDMPILLAVAFVFRPSVAACVAFIAATDQREFRHQISVTRAVFNRAQVALSVFAAGHAFILLGGGIELPQALLPCLGAVLADYAVNVFMVLVLLHFAERRPWIQVLTSLRVGNRVHFFIIYLGYGLLALVLAKLANDSGAWSVLILLAPLLAARQAFDRTRDLEVMAGRLGAQTILVRKAIDQLSEERRDERKLVAGELHDEVLQSLVRINLLSHIVSSQRIVSDAGSFGKDVAEIRDLSRQSVEALRSVILGLHRSPLGGRGLTDALRSLVSRLELEWGADIAVDLSSVTPSRLDEAQQLALYQVGREALLNAIKHARALTYRVMLREDRDFIILTIEDDGVGFDPGSVRNSETHFGLNLARERVTRLGGELTIESDEKGTRLLASVPLGTRSEEPRP